MDEMAEAHRRDYADLNAMRELRNEIREFTDEKPSRCHEETVLALRNALRLLDDDMAATVRVWD